MSLSPAASTEPVKMERTDSHIVAYKWLLRSPPSPLDKMSMQQWMESNRFTSPYRNWYVNYACRDDYGASAGDTLSVL